MNVVIALPEMRPGPLASLLFRLCEDKIYRRHCLKDMQLEILHFIKERGKTEMNVVVTLQKTRPIF